MIRCVAVAFIAVGLWHSEASAQRPRYALERPPLWEMREQEASHLQQTDGTAWRDGETLNFRSAGGAELARLQGERLVYVGRVFDDRFHIVFRDEHEAPSYALVHVASGRITEINGWPWISPDGSHFVAFFEFAAPCEVRLWRVTESAAESVLWRSDLCTDDPALRTFWRSADQVLIGPTRPDAGGEAVTAEFRRENGRWSMLDDRNLRDVRIGVRFNAMDEAVAVDRQREEAKALRASTGLVRRTGSVLRLRLADGRWAALRDARFCEASPADYAQLPLRERPRCVDETDVELLVYRGMLGSGRAFRLDRLLYEGSDGILIDRRSGWIHSLQSEVWSSPDGTLLLTLADCVFVVPGQLDLLEFGERRVRLRYGSHEFCPGSREEDAPKIRWSGSSALTIGPLFRARQADPVALTLRRTETGWRAAVGPAS